jgi:hypothetical protein
MIKFQSIMRNPKTIALLGFAALSMAITMPSCPGQQAMQQQIDDQKKVMADLTTRLVKLDGDLKAIQADVASVKQSAESMAAAMAPLNALPPRLDALEAAVKALQEAAARPAAGKKKK